MAHSQFCLAKKHLGPSGQSLGLKSLGRGCSSSPKSQKNTLLKKKAKIIVGLRGWERVRETILPSGAPSLLGVGWGRDKGRWRGWTQSLPACKEGLPCLGGMVMDPRGAQGDPGAWHREAQGIPTGSTTARISGKAVSWLGGLCHQG